MPLLLPPRGRSYRTALDVAAKQAGLELSPKAEIDGVILIASLAVDGLGIGIVPSTGVPKDFGGSWRRVPLDGLPRRKVGLAQKRRGMQSAPTRALLQALSEVLPGEVRNHPGVHLLSTD